MAGHEEHERAAIELLAPLRGTPGLGERRVQMAQVEALLALAAAIAGRTRARRRDGRRSRTGPPVRDGGRRVPPAPPRSAV